MKRTDEKGLIYRAAEKRWPAVLVICLLLQLILVAAVPHGVLADTILVGSQVQVIGTSGDGLNVRASATTTASIVCVEKDGARGVVSAGPVSAGGFVWWRVQWNDGKSGWSVGSYLKLAGPSIVPGVPSTLKATPGVESVVLTWSGPGDTGATPITAWRIYRDQHSGPTTMVATLHQGDPGFDTCTWSDGPMLIGGQTYWYGVSAVNAGGEGTQCAAVQAVPQAAPVPQGLFFVPPQLDFGGDSTSLALTLQNTGTTPLTFTIVPGASWIAGVSPLAGSIPVSGSQQITVNVSRSGLRSGTYQGLVRVSCGNSAINVPVQMRVGMIQGIDVWRNQSPIDWAAVKAYGVQFAFIKATEGTGITDSCLDQFVPAAQAAGVLVGVYHVAWADENTPAAEAAYFLKVAGHYVAPLALAPVLDLEPRYCLPGVAMVKWIDQWANAVRAATGVTPIIYCCSSVAANLHKADPTIDERYSLWIAAYTTASQPNISGWNSWSFWQYASTDKVPGISANAVDHDWFNGDEQSLQKYVIGGTAGVARTLVSAVKGNGLISADPQQSPYTTGSMVTLTAKPAAGWKFTGWSGDVQSTNNPLAITMDTNKSVIATFAKVSDPDQHVVTLTVGSTTAHVDDQKITLDSPPAIVGGRTLVPLRPIIEGLGGTIAWTAGTRSVQVELGGTTLALQIGNRTAVVNGKSATMDVPASIIKGRTMLPIRFISEHLGAQVQWNQATKTVTITITVNKGTASGE